MKKLKLVLLFLLVLSININAKVIQVVSPGEGQDIQPIVQTEINNAVKGDVILLPIGSFIVNKSILINKFISIMGAAGGTKLYRSEGISDHQIESWGPIIKYDINSITISNILVYNIHFASKKPSAVDGDRLSRAADMGLQIINCVGFTVSECQFEYFGNGAISVTHDDSIVSGWIHHNKFVHNCKGYDALGLGYGVVIYGANKKWITNPRFGSGNFIFVEDNTFDYHRHSIAAGGCALYVFRYNKVYNNIAGNTAHAIDAHEARLDGGSNNYATRAIEVYGNIIINYFFKNGTANCPDGTTIIPGKPASWLVECAIRPRGGEALIHDNYIEGYRFGVGPVVDPNSGIYPVPYQIGYSSGKSYGASHNGSSTTRAAGDLFVWSDSYKAYSTSSQCIYFYNYSPKLLVNERDYHLYAKADYTPYVYPHTPF
jgi:hypothetical protein